MRAKIEIKEIRTKNPRCRQPVLGMTISIGVAVFSDATQNLLIDEHINLADVAMYQAKKSGKNKVVLYSQD